MVTSDWAFWGMGVITGAMWAWIISSVLGAVREGRKAERRLRDEEMRRHDDKLAALEAKVRSLETAVARLDRQRVGVR